MSGYWDEQPSERVLDVLKNALSELAEVENLLADGLGYPRYRDTPRPPSGYPDAEDAFVTGEHTAVTLAMEARSKLLGSS